MRAVFIVVLCLACSVLDARETRSDLISPAVCWHSVIAAMQSGEESEVEKVTTVKGFQTLVRSLDPQKLSTELRRLGGAWKNFEIRLQHQDEHKATAVVGPSTKESQLLFIYTAEGWKLDEWRLLREG